MAGFSIKNLIKLASGEYIALERLESVYKACNVVANICVHAVPAAKQPMAIVIPHEVHLRHALEKAGLDSTGSLASLCVKKEVQGLVLKEINAVGKKNAFKAMELLQAVVLTPDEWTPESGLVTAAQKIQRVAISKAFKEHINVRLPHTVGCAYANGFLQEVYKHDT